MKKYLITALFAVAVSLCTDYYAQMGSPYVVSNVDWKKFYSQAEAMNSAPNVLDANSNFYSTGYTGSLLQKDLIVLKYDSTGVLTYSLMYNNSGNDEGKAIKVDVYGNALVVGYSENIAGGTGKDYAIMKISPSGSHVWPAAVLFDGLGGSDEALAVTIDGNNDVYCTGRSLNPGSGYYNIVTLKLSGTTGAVLWQHRFNGGSGDDVPSAIGISDNGQIVYVTGYTTSSAVNSKDIITYALDASNGVIYWPSPVILNNGGDDMNKALVVTNGNVLTCGFKDNSSVGSGIDFITTLYNGQNGSILWSNDYDSGSSSDAATGLAVDSAGNIGVVGTSFNGVSFDYHTVFYTPAGIPYTTNIEQTGLTSLTAEPKICNDTIAHHWYVSGEKMRINRDIFVYQITPTGTTSWRETIDGHGNDDAATGIAVNGVGVVYTGGLSQISAASFDYTSVKLNQTPVYWPPDYAGEAVNKQFLYLKNQGQLMRTDSTFASEVLYYTHNTTPEVYIEQDAFNFVYNHTDTVVSTLDTLERMQFRFLSANPLATHHEYVPHRTSYNYYLGYALTPEIEDVKGNERIFVPNFYPYIDLHYFSGKGGVKFYLVVKPGAFLGELRMQVNGSVANSIESKYNDGLLIDGQFGDIVLDKPVAYTVNWSGAVVPIVSGQAEWVSYGSDLYGIAPPPGYNTALPLIVQVSSSQISAVPAVTRANLDYSTYYGGQGNERFSDIAIANNGDRHVTGYTDSKQFPTMNSFQVYNAQQDIVFLHYTADDTLRYASVMGGGDPDFGNSIAVNTLGDVFVGGQTNSKDYYSKSLVGASNQTVNGNAGSGTSNQDGFLFKYVPSNPTGQRMVWSRYVGGERADCINSVYVDGNGYLYFAGWTGSSFFPTTSNAQQPQMDQPWGVSVNIDAVFGKIKPTLQNDWVTLCGSSHNGTNTSTATEEGWDITTDNAGNVIACGWTESLNTGNFNATGNPNTFYQPVRKGLRDGFLVKYTPVGVLKFRSNFGGDGFDRITNLFHDWLTDNIYFCGYSTNSSNFPFVTKAGATNSQFKARQNAFVGYMDASLTKQWCTYFGKGSNKDYYATGITMDSYGLVYTSGYTISDSLETPVNYPVTVVYKDSVLKGSEDGFMAIYQPSGLLYHSHYFGGASDDRISSIALDRNSKVWAVGNTASGNFPIAYTSINASLIDSTYNSGQDGFISGFQLEHYQVTDIKKYAYSNSSISVYPNPGNSSFFIDLENQKSNSTEIKVYNMSGQLIHVQNPQTSVTQINCESWANGVYLISVHNNDAYTSFKFIKN